jgi:hypothetical protein
MRCIHHAVPQPAICVICAAEAAARGRRRRLIALLVPVAAGVVYLQTRPKPAPPPPREADNVLRLQEDALKLHPCDAQMLTQRVDRLITLQRLPEALAVARRALGCGIRGRMPWTVSYLEEQLHLWLPNVVSTTGFLLEDPADSDFWWWRADAWMDGKLPRLAMYDLRQSLANAVDAQAGGFAAVRVLDAAKATDQMCEADRAWRYYVRVLGGDPNQDMRDEHAALVRAGTCADTTGKGVVPYQVRVAIGGTTGTFRVDPRAGTTMVSRMFAAKAGLESDPKQLAKVAAGPVSAQHVEALVVEDLPDDGVLGLSFLWHFAIEDTGNGIAVQPLDAKPL